MSIKKLDEIILILERVSMTKRDCTKIARSLKSFIELGNKLKNVNTEGIEPLYSIQEDERPRFRKDEAQVYPRQLVMKNATKTIEDYFCAPITGTHQLQQENKFVESCLKFNSDEIKQATCEEFNEDEIHNG